MPFGKKLTLDAFIIAIFLSALDLGIVAPSLTVIAADLQFPVRAVVWVIALHLAVFVLALPLMEAWGARAGIRNWFALSLLLFAGGSFAAGASDSWVTLIAGRVVQALGAGGIVPLLSVQIRRLTYLRKRSWRVFVHVVLAVLFIWVPMLSSGITWHFGWRWLFWINLPVAAVIYVLSFRFARGGGYRIPDYHTVGLFYFAGILLSAMVAVSQLDPRKGWGMITDPEFLPFAVLTVGLLIPMMMVERQAEHPFFQSELMTDLRLIGLNAAVALAGCTWVAVVLVPGWMADLFGQPRGTGGIYLSIVAGAAWLTLPFARWISARWGYQGGLALGFFFTAAAYFILALMEEPIALLAVLAILGGGLGFTLAAPVHELLFEVVPVRRVKNSLVALAMFRAAGAAFGLVVIGLSFFNPADSPAVNGLPMQWKQGFQTGMLTAAGAAVLGFVISLLLPLPKEVDENSEG
ncbi:MAG: MFS transporter [Firmicutes bacterium]|uniref:Major Facilitator Superfamily protein n=1 Tax=Melghirimyces thermohalophilus TaxID=1236220 RepID=A0A1G6HSR6_9BACL|nr:MFS transporter [Melghirimyces thermohalophilus]MDA8352165.1 MFS transporter [Bacillota bacterium]SDB96536.1 Major Facilitator Superfamily protein [Melghirimyces thermohalophilus]